jgi:hypothetical protein
MPMGEKAFVKSKGPRKLVAVTLPIEVHALLKLAGTHLGTSPTGMATQVIERWAEDWMRTNLDERKTT